MKPHADIKILSGNGNRPLAEAIAQRLGRSLCQTKVERFADKEIWVEVYDNVRGEDVFVVQSGCNPANDNLMELLIMIDALKRASAGRITAVMPYFGYARQDRKPGPRTPISAKLVANLITTAGADRVLTVDLHAGQIQGFFDIPTDNLYASPVFAQYARRDYNAEKRPDPLMVVSPDVGGVVRARTFANTIGADIAIVDKHRPRAGVSEVMAVIGDVTDRTCILFDDIVDSAGTLCNAAEKLIEKGAKEVHAFCTHGVLSKNAVERVENSVLGSLLITDSIPLSDAAMNSPKVRVASLAPMLAEAVRSIAGHDSVSRLFRHAPIA